MSRTRVYMATGLHEFQVGTTHLYQTLLVKPVRGRSELPLTREDWYVPATTAFG